MQHPYYPLPDKFKPNGESINTWLRTRKNLNQNKPGIFETVNFRSDRNWSTASILIELSAFLTTFYGAFLTFQANHVLFDLILALIVVVLFVLFDVIGIMLHGHDKPQKVLDRSELLVTQNPQHKKELYDRLKEITWREFIGILLLTLSAVLKIFALLYFFQKKNIPIVVIFSILYLLVIYIHSYHTVFWWPARRLKLALRKQSDAFMEYFNQNLPTNPDNTIDGSFIWSFHFNSNAQCQNKKIDGSSEGRVNIIYNGGTSYTLNCTGLLWDENIVNLAGQWDEEFVNDLIHACIKVQLLQANVIVDGGAIA